jgi:hypothetical protein
VPNSGHLGLTRSRYYCPNSPYSYYYYPCRTDQLEVGLRYTLLGVIIASSSTISFGT